MQPKKRYYLSNPASAGGAGSTGSTFSIGGSNNATNSSLKNVKFGATTINPTLNPVAQVFTSVPNPPASLTKQEVAAIIQDSEYAKAQAQAQIDQAKKGAEQDAKNKEYMKYGLIGLGVVGGLFIVKKLIS